MKEGQVSQTAILAAFMRAIADRLRLTSRFVDPVALEWLPEPERERARSFPNVPPKAFRERWTYAVALAGAKMMAARSVEVDDAIRAAKSDQVVILGAGHATRAWRMAELSGATVFEVDHPDTQRDKRDRAEGRVPQAKALHFVAASTPNGGAEGATSVRKSWRPWSSKTCRLRSVAPPGRHSAPSKARPSRMRSSWRLPRCAAAASSTRPT
jgi:O-methyltransferase involved in polyketide biosynthesis